MSREPACRFCGHSLRYTFIDLGMSPLANGFLTAEQCGQMEPFYPLHAYVCGACFLVQVEQFETPQHIFSHYAYFSSYSSSWLRHAQQYVEEILQRFPLDAHHLVVEIGSNDGYLLQYFQEQAIRILGIEPAANVAEAAQGKGIPTLCRFFSAAAAQELADQGQQADLIVANNVMAHVPDLNSFVQGCKILLKTAGIITIEFPHLLTLMEEKQFDTIYHEHFSYFSLLTVVRIFQHHGLTIFDVEQLPTHGGSLRIYARHQEGTQPSVSPRVEALLAQERQKGFERLETYLAFSQTVFQIKSQLLKFFIQAQEANRSVAGYGAPAKGNTLLNYCGIKPDWLAYTVDRNPHKQGLFLPGTHIPIYGPERIQETRPDYVLILPWNLKKEICQQMAFIRQWGGQFVVPIPEVAVWS